MMIGLFTLSPVTQRLVCEQLEAVYSLVFFETIEKLMHAFQTGAVMHRLEEEDDYFVVTAGNATHIFSKPIRFPHLLQYLSSLVSQHTHQIGPYLFSPQRRLLEKVKNGRTTIQLREKETELLLFLVTAPEGYASRQTLLQHIWGFQQGMETRTLETHIYQLRQKIEANHQKPKLLLNTEEGYRLMMTEKNLFHPAN